ncbi:hypothetical protein AVEN_232116-1 [Araneus ventricosus]|uniref:Uncharacterized protein n=1 Tax=Araneus ventricosus TaxID=182803 RepID=A0A4Y2FXC6_ARAVE|nr:hypothetical protein AVEN_232116-1 [Araneus ventricosus]
MLRRPNGLARCKCLPRDHAKIPAQMSDVRGDNLFMRFDSFLPLRVECDPMFHDLYITFTKRLRWSVGKDSASGPDGPKFGTRFHRGFVVYAGLVHVKSDVEGPSGVARKFGEWGCRLGCFYQQINNTNTGLS